MRWRIHKVICLGRPWVLECPGYAGLRWYFDTWDEAMQALVNEQWQSLTGRGQ